MRRSDKKKLGRGEEVKPKLKAAPKPTKVQPGQQGVNPNKKVVGTISITVYDDLDVDVSNFPADHGTAMMAMCNAMMKVSVFFVKQGGKPKPLIQVAKPGGILSLAEIERLSKDAKNN